MPLPAGVLAAGISAGGNLLSGVLQGIQNSKNRKFALEMYDLQRQHALQDWTRDAYYNSPQQQMKRLKKAGLNPHLVYGNGADAQVSPVRGTSASVPQGTAPQVDTGGIISAYFNTQQQEQQTNLLKENIKLAQQEQQIKVIEAIQKLVDVDTSKFDLDQKKKWQDTLSSLQATSMEFENRLKDQNIFQGKDQFKTQQAQTIAQTQAILDGNRRANRLQPLTEAQMKQQLKSIQQTIMGAIMDNGMKALEYELKKAGTSFSDPVLQRKVFDIIEKYAQKIEGFKTLSADEKAQVLMPMGHSILSYFQTK